MEGDDFWADFGPTVSLTTRIREVLSEYGAGLPPLLELLQVHRGLVTEELKLMHASSMVLAILPQEWIGRHAMHMSVSCKCESLSRALLC